MWCSWWRAQIWGIESRSPWCTSNSSCTCHSGPSCPQKSGDYWSRSRGFGIPFCQGRSAFRRKDLQSPGTGIQTVICLSTSSCWYLGKTWPFSDLLWVWPSHLSRFFQGIDQRVGRHYLSCLPCLAYSSCDYSRWTSYSDQQHRATHYLSNWTRGKRLQRIHAFNCGDGCLF